MLLYALIILYNKFSEVSMEIDFNSMNEEQLKRVVEYLKRLKEIEKELKCDVNKCYPPPDYMSAS